MVKFYLSIALAGLIAFAQAKTDSKEELEPLIPHPTAAYHDFEFGEVSCRTHENGYLQKVTHHDVIDLTKKGTGVPVLGLGIRNTLYKVNLGHDKNGEEDIHAYFRILKSEDEKHAEKLVHLYVSTEYVCYLSIEVGDIADFILREHASNLAC